MLTYTELVKRDDFLERYRYLKLDGLVGVETFGSDRHINQKFYASREWKLVRDHVIIRDQGFDLGVPGFEIHKALIHHMNPIQLSDIVDFNPDILDPEFLITVSTKTHNAIHFSDESQICLGFNERKPGDTKLW